VQVVEQGRRPVQRAQLGPRLPPERVHVPLDDRPLRQVRSLREPHRAGGRLLRNRHRLRRRCHRGGCDSARGREKHTAPADRPVLAVIRLRSPVLTTIDGAGVQPCYSAAAWLGGPDIDDPQTPDIAQM
jgi:hypothetical protein